MANLEAAEALRIITAIVTGGLSELDNVARAIAEAARAAGNAIRSEDSDLGTTVNRIGEMFEMSLNEQIKNALSELVRDFREYQVATTANEEETKAEVNNINSIFDSISSGIIGIIKGGK